MDNEIFSGYLTYRVQQKSIPLKLRWQYFSNDWEFLTKTFTLLYCVHSDAKFYSIISNFEKVMPC